MIYIPFFIVILIDKRGVREAERSGKRERTVRTQNDTQIRYRYDIDTIQIRIPSSTPVHRSGKEVQQQRYSSSGQ